MSVCEVLMDHVSEMFIIVAPQRSHCHETSAEVAHYKRYYGFWYRRLMNNIIVADCEYIIRTMNT